MIHTPCLVRKCSCIYLAAALASPPAVGAEVRRNGSVMRGDAGFAAPTVSLADAQSTALEKNWDLLAAAAGVDTATAQTILAREFPNPSLSFSWTMINVDHHPSATTEGNGFWERNYDTIFAINQLFEIGGKRRNRKASARAGFEAARALFLDAKRTLDLGVTKAYVAAVQAEEN